MVDGKVIAITGASSGIGQAAALHLAKLGAKVVLGARHEEGLARLTQDIQAAGGDAHYRMTDVSNREDVRDLVLEACEKFGRLDVLFSNAGAMPIGPLDELAVDDWERMVDVNIKGVLFGIAAALPVFRQQGFGHFIHTGSTSARKTVRTRSSIRLPRRQFSRSPTVSGRSWPVRSASASSRLGSQTRPSAST
jgi:NADP-dependent 3-hydroxy acid dehydrogenase YdfG